MTDEKYQYGPHELTRDQAELVQGLVDDARSRHEGGDPGALEHSVASKPYDPAFVLLLDGVTSDPVVYREGCYICEDPEFAAMGLPLCFKCPACVRSGRGLGHIPADDNECDECGYQHSPLDYGEKGRILPEPSLPPPGES
jgi:hypothetical protein